jgi:hypothetical protein
MSENKRSEYMKRITPYLLVAAVSLTAGNAWSQGQGWPRVVKDGKTQIVVYQPQPDSLDGVTLQSRVAVSVKRPQDNTPLFGAIWVVATLDIDRDRDMARVVSAKVDRTRFADVADDDLQSLVQFLEADAPLWDLSISLTQLKASLQPAGGGPDADYRNDPPKIVMMDSPAILLLLDGEPRLQEAGSGGLQRVVNTALPVIFDPRTRQYWFYGSSVWFTTGDLLRGNWTSSYAAPSNIAALVKDTDTLNSAQADAGKAASPAQLRSAKIIVAAEPTELVVTEGVPKYSPLAGGDILYVTNTDSDIFLEVPTQRYFLLISGRWFAGRSMQGPWSFVAPENLPKAFAAIPEKSPKAHVLAFVPGTDSAKDAVMDNIIPQTAEVSRRDAKIDVQYDGAPKFSPVPNTSLQYAENTPSEVILSKGKYYACEEGVWYVAPSPTGPWSVSDVRPAGVDDIPPSSPVYNTKYVYIYESTPEFVYVGYLPGYRWSFPYHGVVVYGTGWRYRGWFGRYYYPRPITWGFCVRYNPWAGWTFGMSWTPGWLGLSSQWGAGWAGWMPVYGPGYPIGFWSGYYAGGWFGPGGYRPPRPPHWRPPVRPGGGPVTIQPYPYPGPGRPRNNLYSRPGNSGVRPRPATLPVRPRPGAGQPQNQPGRPGGESPSGRGPGRSGTGAPATQPQPSPPPQPGSPDAATPGGKGAGGRGSRGRGISGRGQGKGTPSATPRAPVTKPDTKRPNNVFADRDGNVHRNTEGNWQKREDQTWRSERPPTPQSGSQPSQEPRPQPQTTIRAEPRDGGSMEAERNARDRGSERAPRGGQQNRGGVAPQNSKRGSK